MVTAGMLEDHLAVRFHGRFLFSAFSVKRHLSFLTDFPGSLQVTAPTSMVICKVIMSNRWGVSWNW